VQRLDLCIRLEDRNESCLQPFGSTRRHRVDIGGVGGSHVGAAREEQTTLKLRI
jgi:hypothetical protein